jgi:hypothetical protein
VEIGAQGRSPIKLEIVELNTRMAKDNPGQTIQALVASLTTAITRTFA